MTTLRLTTKAARGTLLAAVGFAAMSVARGVLAAETLSESDNVPRVVVRYSDLKLASPQDARRLLQRIAEAAVQICGDPTLTGDLSARARERRCVSTAVARAVDAVASEKLTMAYDQSRYAPHRGLPLSPRAASIAATPGR